MGVKLPRLITKASDLVTSPRAVCDGFLAQALNKAEKAKPFVNDAKRLLKHLRELKSIEEAAKSASIQGDLLAAAGFSDKAQKRINASELTAALAEALKASAGNGYDDWREEIVYRFLLTKGDSLGGSMRNLTGALAGAKFTECVQSALQEKNIAVKVMKSRTNEEKIQEIHWKNRSILFDKKPKFFDKNIDVLLFDTTGTYVEASALLSKRECFLACGELKGGIDPAGADEHWKTADTALGRIRKEFTGKPLALFFVGAAIENSMAKEIFEHLKNGTLSHAANLTVGEQVLDLARWLVSL